MTQADYGWMLLRAERDRLLRDSDWTQSPDCTANREAWAAYRQALRDLPAATVNPWATVWPTAPGDDDMSATRATNLASIKGRAAAALDVDRAYLALPTPTTADQDRAQVRALTRQCIALIQLTLGRLDTDG